jgi:hypothetical protein
MNVVPFELGALYGNFASGHGLLRIEDNQLCLEFQVRDNLVGIWKSSVRQVRIPRADLASVTLECGWFGFCNSLVIQVTRMEAVQDVPGMSKGRVILKIARKDRAAAERLITALEISSLADEGRRFDLEWGSSGPAAEHRYPAEDIQGGDRKKPSDHIRRARG